MPVPTDIFRIWAATSPKEPEAVAELSLRTGQQAENEKKRETPFCINLCYPA